MKLLGPAVLVFGSRTLADERVDAEIAKFLVGKDFQFLITALEPEGVCKRVKHFVKKCERGIVLIEVSLDGSRAAGMHEARSINALMMADHMLAIWDGKSKGTAGEIAQAQKHGVPTTIVQLEPIHNLKVWAK